MISQLCIRNILTNFYFIVNGLFILFRILDLILKKKLTKMLIDPFNTTLRISISNYIQLHVGKNCINHAPPSS